MEHQRVYEREINLGQLASAILRKSKNIILSGLIVAVLIAGFKYITTGSEISNQEQIINDSVTDYMGQAKIFLGSDTDTATAEAIRAYLTGNAVIQNVIGSLKLNEDIELTYADILEQISLQNSTNTIVTINFVGDDEALVQDITDLIVTIGSEMISEKFNKEEVMILEQAYTELREYNVEVKSMVHSNSLLLKQLMKYSILGFVLGAFLATGIYLFIILLDTTIQDEKDIEGYLGLPVLGKIPVVNGTKKLVMEGKKEKKTRLTQYSEE